MNSPLLFTWLLGALVGSTCAAVALLFLYARFVLLAQINRARDLEREREMAASKRFRSPHRRSVLINALQLVLLIGLNFYPSDRALL